MMMITVEELRTKLVYDPDTGLFYRKGRPAGAISGNGRIYIGIGARRYLAHRLAWLYVYGSWPADQLDHINGNPLDNRIENLRECSHKQNQENRTSWGVDFFPRSNKYRAQIRHDGRKIHIGLYDTEAEAREAYAKAKLQYHSFNPVTKE